MSEDAKQGMDELVLGVAQPPLPSEPAAVPKAPLWIYKPTPLPPALLSSNLPLCYEAPQLERVAAILAASSPLIAAAQPLLDVLADMPQTLAADEVAVFHQALQREVANFQSVCVEARLPRETIVMGSYVLCVALDEAAGQSTWGRGDGEEVGAWASRQLAAQFHGDTEGGVKVFQLLVNLYPFVRQSPEPAAAVDVVDLIGLVLALGFEGVCRGSARGGRTLDDMRRELYAVVKNAREEADDKLALAQRKLSERRPSKPPVRTWGLTPSFLRALAWAVDIGPAVVLLAVIGWGVWQAIGFN